jgi:hypothetical protein
VTTLSTARALAAQFLLDEEPTAVCVLEDAVREGIEGLPYAIDWPPIRVGGDGIAFRSSTGVFLAFWRRGDHVFCDVRFDVG